MCYIGPYSTYSTYSKELGKSEGGAPYAHSQEKKISSPPVGEDLQHFLPMAARPQLPGIASTPAAPARHSLQPAHRGRDSDFALPPRSELRLRFFAEKPITGPAPKVREICCPRSITPGVFFPSPGQRRRSVSDAVLAVSLTECFFTTHTLPSILAWAQDCPTQSWRGRRIAPLNPGVGAGLPHSILAWAQDCPFNPAVVTGLLHPFLLPAQDCPGALRAARAWNCSCPSAGL